MANPLLLVKTNQTPFGHQLYPYDELSHTWGTALESEPANWDQIRWPQNSGEHHLRGVGVLTVSASQEFGLLSGRISPHTRAYAFSHLNGWGTAYSPTTITYTSGQETRSGAIHPDSNAICISTFHGQVNGRLLRGAPFNALSGWGTQYSVTSVANIWATTFCTATEFSEDGAHVTAGGPTSSLFSATREGVYPFTSANGFGTVVAVASGQPSNFYPQSKTWSFDGTRMVCAGASRKLLSCGAPDYSQAVASESEWDSSWSRGAKPYILNDKATTQGFGSSSGATYRAHAYSTDTGFGTMYAGGVYLGNGKEPSYGIWRTATENLFVGSGTVEGAVVATHFSLVNGWGSSASPAGVTGPYTQQGAVGTAHHAQVLESPIVDVYPSANSITGAALQAVSALLTDAWQPDPNTGRDDPLPGLRQGTLGDQHGGETSLSVIVPLLYASTGLRITLSDMAQRTLAASQTVTIANHAVSGASTANGWKYVYLVETEADRNLLEARWSHITPDVGLVVPHRYIGCFRAYNTWVRAFQYAHNMFLHLDTFQFAPYHNRNNVDPSTWYYWTNQAEGQQTQAYLPRGGVVSEATVRVAITNNSSAIPHRTIFVVPGTSASFTDPTGTQFPDDQIRPRYQANTTGSLAGRRVYETTIRIPADFTRLGYWLHPIGTSPSQQTQSRLSLVIPSFIDRYR